MKLFEFADNQLQVAQLSADLAATLNHVIERKGHATLAVSGGKSPIKLFEQLSHQDLAWDHITITLVDERFVATDDEASNEKLVRDHLLINHAQNAFFVGLADLKIGILKSVTNANIAIREIDIAVLGMGEDGHTASLFPCSKEIKTALDPKLTPETYIITTPTTAPHLRIGLSLAGILEIPHLFLSINGASKREIIQNALHNDIPAYPVGNVLAARKDTQVYWSA